ncbi:MAG: ABC transporter ATP-binding protein [Anaerolineae bacterium]|nr:ABC transporter ATP-binding protein [Anaerolineae bacterium]
MAHASEFTTHSNIKSDRRSAARFIWSHVRRHPLYGILMLVGAFANAAFAGLVFVFIGEAFNALNAGEGLDAIVKFGLAIIASQGLRAALQITRNFSAEIFAQRIERDVRDELYASLLGKSMTFHDLQPVGEIMARVTNDVRELNFMMNPGFNLIIGSGMFLIVPLFSSFALYPTLIIPPIIFLIAYVIVQYFYLRNLTPIAEDVRVSFGKMNADVEETLEGLQVVKGAGQEAYEERHFDKLLDEVRHNTIRQYDMEARYLPMLLLGLVMAGGLALSVYLYLQGQINIGTLVAYSGQLSLFGFPVFSSMWSFSNLALGYASAGRILSIINIETDLDQNLQGHTGKIHGSIRFDHVEFGYHAEDNTPALHDINFEVYAGKTVAIVGQTGSGKSTITKLINRIYDIDSGTVEIDGINVKDWNLHSLRSQISVIEQDIYLFSRTIAENIRFGKSDATREEIIEAAKKAQAHEFIMSFPEGYDTVVGQRGANLSGGQRQRLALARAFVTDPPILVLDDSTSAIDSATEDKIQKAIWTAAEGRTTLLITHRLSQIRWADHIIVLRQGHVVAQGNHDQLMASSSAYRRIFARYEDSEQNQHDDKITKVAQN